MSQRLAPLLAAVLLALCGCAQRGDAPDKLGAIIFEQERLHASAPARDHGTPAVIPVGWGKTIVYPEGARAPPPPVAWGEAIVVPAGEAIGPYLLDTGDTLRVFVYGQPNLSRLYKVDQQGAIAVPLIGTVWARGLTTTELARTIADQLSREYVRDPHVTVDVSQNRPFFILGEVRNAGQYPYVSGMSVETAVAIAGGYTERASERRFRITRRIGGLIDQIEAPSDYLLLPGDTVYVFERFL